MPKDQELSQHSSQPPATTIPAASAPTDPLTRMLSEAMSRARVSEKSGAPLTAQGDYAIKSSTTDSLPNLSPGIQPHEGPNSAVGSAQPGGVPTTNDVPSFLLALLSKDREMPSGADGVLSPIQQQTALLNSLTGAGSHPSSTDRRDSRTNGLPLSAEFLPPSVMPSGLYPSNAGANVINTGAFTQQQSGEHPSPSLAITSARLLNRPNGLPAQGSPMQAPAFAYSPGLVPSPLMPSPLVMPMMQGGPLMRPPPPPMPFQYPLMGPPSMSMPPPPLPQQPPHAGASFPADAMHAAMGAVGFMQQHQRGFVGQGKGIMSKAEFSQQFLGLLRSDPQFMD
ncbi:hypothetical protein BGZ65_003722, partial [Modicella reniformis]